MLINAIKVLVKQLKQITFYKKWCNYYLIKSQNLYFQNKFYIYKFFHPLRALVSKTLK